jgi:hypothetical protein
MGLGVLEDKVLDHVPGKFSGLLLHRKACAFGTTVVDTIWLGTSYMVEDRTDDHAAVDSHLKYDRSGDVPVLLVPQPSDDPNDPLVG